MLSYITPTRFRESALGVDVSDKSDAELLSLISIGSALVNRHCAVPPGHDFRGGDVTGEHHRWRTGNTHGVPIQRIWPRHRPVSSVTSMTIYITNTWTLVLAADKLYVNTAENWIEPIGWPYTAYGTIAPLGTLPIGLRDPVATVDYHYGRNFPVTDEMLEPSSGKTLAASNQYWTDDPVEVKADGTALTAPTDYTFDATEGTVELVTYDPDVVYTASYTYSLPVEIGKATALIVNDLLGQSAIAGSGLLGLSGIRVEEIELRQSSKVNFLVQPVNAAATLLLSNYVNWSWGR